MLEWTFPHQGGLGKFEDAKKNVKGGMGVFLYILFFEVFFEKCIV